MNYFTKRELYLMGEAWEMSRAGLPSTKKARHLNLTAWLNTEAGTGIYVDELILERANKIEAPNKKADY